MRLIKLIVLPSLALMAAGQQPQEELPTIKVEVNVVNILCSVRDKNGRLIKDLSKDDFIVKEEGKPQKIKYFARETNLPLTIGLLVDVSRSQENLIEIERRTAAQFFPQVLRKKDMAFLISFGSEVELLQDFTNSTTLLQRGLEELRVNAAVSGIQPGPVPTIYHPRGTVLFDAVYLAAREKLRPEVGRKAIILITDGVDMGSRVKLEDALEAAHKADSIIYSIYYVDRSVYSGPGGFGFGGVSDSDLRKMSDETGGRLFKVNKKNPLNEIFDEIQEEMRSQYSIGYTPSDPAQDGSFREIKIETRQKGLKVQARKGYYALKPGSR
jgi:VWFA-related protein